MIKFKGDENVFVMSDSHFGHKNICRGVTDWRLPDGSIPVDQTRDFKTIEKMNETIVNNINSVVGQDDHIVHLGDWSFGGYENIPIFRSRIVCKNIYLICGNHDDHIVDNKNGYRGLFTKVYNDRAYMRYGQYRFVLDHYPIQSWRDLKKGVMMLHGHVHLPNNLKFGKGRKMDCGMDGHPEFRPYNLSREIIPMLLKREILSEMAFDHHTDNMKNIVG